MGVRDIFYTLLRVFVSGIVPAKRFDPDIKTGLDGSFLIHPVLHRHAVHIVFSNDWSGFEEDIRKYLSQFRRWGSTDSLYSKCTLGVVFDGMRVTAKEANAEREELRGKAASQIQEIKKTPRVEYRNIGDVY